MEKQVGRIYGYARVSSREQNLDRQIDDLKKAGVEVRDIIQEKASGKDIAGRPQYQMLKERLLRPGDTLVLTSLDRLSRSKDDVLNELQYYRSNHIRVQIMDLPTTMSDRSRIGDLNADLIDAILIEVYAYIAEQERRMIKQRQKEGIEAARARGKKFGRPAIACPQNFPALYHKVQLGELTSSELMRMLDLKHSTYYRFVREQEAKEHGMDKNDPTES